MPTASKLVGALLFAALGYVVSLIAMPLLEDLETIPRTPEINAVIGLGIGWFMAGPRAGGGIVEGLSNGITTMVVGLLAVLLVHGSLYALRASMRGRHSDPSDTIEAMVDFMLQSAQRLATPEVIIMLLAGGAVIGLLLEFTRSQAA